uniref:Ras-related protein Rab-39B-like n=1 Tax=Dromaius novaehollandiae TaxID=8790 RepID=A0A8C4JP08_DRONO
MKCSRLYSAFLSRCAQNCTIWIKKKMQNKQTIKNMPSLLCTSSHIAVTHASPVDRSFPGPSPEPTTGTRLADSSSLTLQTAGHKCDLDTQRQVTRHEAEKLAAAYGMKYIETSARDAINVEKAFTDLTRDIYELVKRGDISIQEGWEGVKSGFVPNVVHSSEEVVKSDRRCLC